MPKLIKTCVMKKLTSILYLVIFFFQLYTMIFQHLLTVFLTNHRRIISKNAISYNVAFLHLGFFIYKELNGLRSASGFYSVPKNVKHNGMIDPSRICTVATRNKRCVPMTRICYSLYQYMTFYTASITILFYFP